MSERPELDTAVVVDGVSKTFRLPQERMHTLKERALHPLRRSRFEWLDALKDVSFGVRRGEFFGILGRNGSGKSTLLKCLAGIYRVDRGAIYVDGRVSTFIELGVGFNPDLAARDNVKINAVMLGLSPGEAEERYERVIDFAELHEFEDLKLKNYSSGMQVRLAFSVMIQVDADILLIDEVLAVGDASFQQKCFDAFARMKDEGRTILFVTHDMGAVRRFCDRAMLIERGEVQLIDEPERVANHYIELNFRREQQENEVAPGGAERFGTGEAELVDAWFEGEDGLRTTALPQLRSCTFRARVRFKAPMPAPSVAVLFENDRHHPVFATSTQDAAGVAEDFRAGDEALFSVSFENLFAPGRVFASPWVARRGIGGGAVMDRRPRMTSVVVTGLRQSGGLVDVPHEVRLERLREPVSTQPA